MAITFVGMLERTMGQPDRKTSPANGTVPLCPLLQGYRVAATDRAGIARARQAEDHLRVNRRTALLSRKHRELRARIARVICLALLLVLANSTSAWAMQLRAAPAAQGTQHCHDMTSHENAPARGHDHGAPCPCCDHGCACLFSGAATLPVLLVLPASIAQAGAPTLRRASPPTVPIAEQLRPPIA